MEKEKEMTRQGQDGASFGMIHVYTGDGKGKTTAALGLAFRACGHGLKSCMIQFMKNPEMMGFRYGEIQATQKKSLGIEIHSFGRPGWIRAGEATEEDHNLALSALKKAGEVLKDPEFHIVILDEIFLPLHFGIIATQDVLTLIDSKPSEKELILTGRGAPPEVIERADLVTEMRAVKHYFDKGQPARKGIEY